MSIDPPEQSALWWRLPENEQGPHKRSFLEEQLTKRSIDRIVLDYFIQEGFHSAAQSLAEEADISLDTFRIGGRRSSENCGSSLGFSTIVKRREIKYLILEGNISQAIRLIAENFPATLDSQPLLFFLLLRLNLIEMIRKHKCLPDANNPEIEKKFISDILSFVRENMISKVLYSVSLLKDLETTMSLLCFDFDPEKPLDELVELPPKLRELFDLSLRRQCYREVNRAILDLNDNLVGINYNGVSTEYSVSNLKNLREATLAGDDVDMDSSDDDEPFQLKSDALQIPGLQGEEVDTLSTDVRETDAEQVTVTKKQILRSQLERIAVLWLATERKVKEHRLHNADASPTGVHLPIVFRWPE